MSCTIIFYHDEPGETLSLILRDAAGDTVNGAGDELTEGSGLRYAASVSEDLSGWYVAQVFEEDGDLLYTGNVKVANDGGTYRIDDPQAGIPAVPTVFEIRTEIDTNSTKLMNLDAKVSECSTFNAANDEVKLISAYNAAKTASQAGDAMTLTSGERSAVATAVESAIINETDSNAVLEAIVQKIADANPDLGGLTVSAIAIAARDAVLDALLTDHDESGSIGKAVADILSKTNNLPIDPASETNATSNRGTVTSAIGLLNNVSSLQVQVAAAAAMAEYGALQPSIAGRRLDVTSEGKIEATVEGELAVDSLSENAIHQIAEASSAVNVVVTPMSGVFPPDISKTTLYLRVGDKSARRLETVRGKEGSQVDFSEYSDLEIIFQTFDDAPIEVICEFTLINENRGISFYPDKVVDTPTLPPKPHLWAVRDPNDRNRVICGGDCVVEKFARKIS